MTSIPAITTDCPLSQEDSKCLRIMNLILRIAPAAVRIKFDKEFHPSGLQKVLNQARVRVLEYLRKKKVINQTQWDMIFPVSGKYD